MPASLAYFRVLADRVGKPAGLLIDLGEGDDAALRPSLDGGALAALAAKSPLFHRAGIAPALAARLHAVGIAELAPGTLFRADDKFASEFLPESVQWIDGDWCLAAPAKTPGAQAASRATALQLVQLVANDADTHEIEALLRRDPTLSYNLLRVVNSLGMGASRKITSFSQALLILGRQQLRRWLNLMLFSARDGDVRSAMLLARVAQRARALELLAKLCGLDKSNQEQAFMSGMFSLLGVLFAMPLPEVLAPLAISDAMSGALLRGEGDLGALLRLVETAGQGDFGGLAAQLSALQIDPVDFNEAMIEATDWMLSALNQGAANG